jgi:hypothetical protein
VDELPAAGDDDKRAHLPAVRDVGVEVTVEPSQPVGVEPYLVRLDLGLSGASVAIASLLSRRRRGAIITR